METLVCIKNESNDDRIIVGEKYFLVSKETFGDGNIGYFVAHVNDNSGLTSLQYKSSFITESEYIKKLREKKLNTINI